MLKVINKHLTELSDNDLLQSLTYILKSQVENKTFTYKESEITIFFDYVLRNVLSKNKHQKKASKIVNYIYYYKNELYNSLKKFPIFTHFIKAIYRNNINID